MTTKLKTELFIEDSLGNESIIYPIVESNHVSFDNGMTIENMIAQNVSTPIVVHESQSFKVGVGDSDISKSIVDSSVGNMTIKGQTYQNIIPDPSLRNKTNGNAVQKFNNGYDSVNAVDGVVKSAVLSGQTLVNLVVKNYIEAGNGIAEKVNGKNLKVSITSEGSKVFSFNLTQKLVQGKKYFVYAPYTVTSNVTKKLFVSFYNGTSFAKDMIEYSNYCIINPTDADSYTKLVIGLHYPFSVGDSFELNYPMLIEYQEGMENWDIPYFTGMTSSKMPVLSSFGKNLISYLPTQEKDGLKFIHSGSQSEVIISGTCTNSVSDYYFARSTAGAVVDTEVTKLLSNATIGTKFYMSNNLGKECYFGVSRNGSSTITWTSGSVGYEVKEGDINAQAFVRFKQGDTYNGETLKIQLEINSSTTTYEQHKSNILSLSEDVVLRSLPNGICDTYNLVTKEYVQRVGEIVLNGNEADWGLLETNENTYRFVCHNSIKANSGKAFCDLFKVTDQNTQGSEDSENICIRNDRLGIGLRLSKTKVTDINTFKTWLQKNPITVQYQLATPVVKTVDLSSSGNWNKVVLNGQTSENWVQNSHTGNFIQFNGYSNFCLYSLNLPIANAGLITKDMTYKNYDSGFRSHEVEGISDGGGYKLVFVRIKTDKLPTNDVSGFKQYLSQNPIELIYQTNTSQANSIKEMLSFSNGHIQLSSGAENSLIPSIDYEVPTSNSYHLDLAKTGTKYTMKNMSGTFTIDGTQYNASTNGVFTTPSAMINKLMVTSLTQSNAMLLENDVTSKTIPYFKGIKSAFEDKDKIEVLSCGKNLFDPNIFKDCGIAIINEDGSVTLNGTLKSNYIFNYTIEKGQYCATMFGDNATCVHLFWGGSDEYFNRLTPFTISERVTRTGYIERGSYNNVTIRLLLEKGNTKTTYEPYKSNGVKIPLLFPSRSLPSGVYDEVVLDRENNKAKIIKRIGKVVLDVSQISEWYMDNSGAEKVCRIRLKVESLGAKKGQKKIMSNLFSVTDFGFSYDGEIIYMDGSQNYWLWLHIQRNKLSEATVAGVKLWLSQNQVVAYYELETPIITEVDIEGFPYIYKDGHIFLNTEIAPITTIKYSINQSHVIESQNSDLIRHEKELDYLYKLIGEYVRVSYASTLLTLDLELK